MCVTASSFTSIVTTLAPNVRSNKTEAVWHWHFHYSEKRTRRKVEWHHGSAAVPVIMIVAPSSIRNAHVAFG